jgi:HPr kinase/phosphorylase
VSPTRHAAARRTGSPVAARLHASVVALRPQPACAPRGVILLGPSGAGKSALALQLMAFGALLVADDQTCLEARTGALFASAPDATRGLIEARGVGLLSARTLPAARLVLAVDLGQEETARLPPPRNWTALGVVVPLLHAVASAHFPAAIMQYLRTERSDPL